MRRVLIPLLGAAFAVVCLVGKTGGGEKIPAQQVDGNIRWVYDYAAGKEEARRTGRPMFVVFRCER